MSDPSTPPVTYEVADGVGTVTFDRPDSMNSLTLATKVALRDAMHEAAADSAVRCVVLTGTGRAFCVGQDLKEHVAELTGDGAGGRLDTVAEHYNPTVTAIATMPKPVIAAVNGIAAGAGASLAFAADFRVLRRSAGFNLAFAGIALSCDTGASWTLPRLVGHGRATQLLMQPRTIGADEAHALGLATKVVDDADFDAEVATLARALADGPTLALASIKRALAFSATHDLPSSLENEAQKMALTGQSDDHLAAVKAFLAKEKPTFTGR
ncbi:enoyl-CoA hydratase-related protein [Aeromicrobium sp.]|uniref:enoyl-CoA hydratase-related protein n=1 Tax=Aeromicrobium sp. TaxID=1871063 RepID=UPI00198C9F16|nr:enoyl-CoA hydratase-related protein [Aeromicrobium sp.]MBC7632763.1 enoyl-CoA hydratase/isomerase family protein [Aeromicrobium sp.]